MHPGLLLCGAVLHGMLTVLGSLSRLLGPGGAWVFIGCADDLVPGLAGRGGDHFGHLPGAQVKGLTSKF